jgi:hypothetical protein
MTRALTRTNFHSSRLVRILSDLAVVESVKPGVAFAEKLAQWFDITHAINLRAAHTASPPSTSLETPPVTGVVVGEAFARMRLALENSITRRGDPVKGRTRLEMPSPQFGVPIDAVTAYAPYRRYYLAHQREMDLNVRPWRAKVREVLAKTSPTLKQLADLDAALDGILCDRESKLLSTVPLLLEQRFGQLLKAHQQRLVDTQQTDHPDFWMKPGGWLARFCNELQTVLLAELDVRLQPILGLIEAMNNEKTKHL